MVLHYGDLTDSANLVKIITEVKPTEVYNLGAMSHVKVSFDMAEYTGNVDGLGTLRLLESLRTAGLSSTVRFYQASTSELYGKVQEIPQTEKTPFYPRSPYGPLPTFTWPCHISCSQVSQSSTPTGLLSTTVKPTTCTAATAFSSTTRARDEARRSSHARSPAESRKSLWGSKTLFVTAVHIVLEL